MPEYVLSFFSKWPDFLPRTSLGLLHRVFYYSSSPAIYRFGFSLDPARCSGLDPFSLEKNSVESLDALCKAAQSSPPKKNHQINSRPN